LAGGLGATQEPVLFMTAGVRKRSAPGGSGTAWHQSIRRKARTRAPDQARQVAYCATLATHQSGQTVQPQHRPLCQSTPALNTPYGRPALDTNGLPQWQHATQRGAAQRRGAATAAVAQQHGGAAKQAQITPIALCHVGKAGQQQQRAPTALRWSPRGSQAQRQIRVQRARLATQTLGRRPNNRPPESQLTTHRLQLTARSSA
jgi:hypothetical protein